MCRIAPSDWQNARAPTISFRKMGFHIPLLRGWRFGGVCFNA
jgi:hypothetical protein